MARLMCQMELKEAVQGPPSAATELGRLFTHPPLSWRMRALQDELGEATLQLCYLVTWATL